MSSAPARTRRWLKRSAVLLNLLLFGVGVYFELRPRYPSDAWSAGAVGVVAAVNAAALTVGSRGRTRGELRRRLRRIALLANAFLVAAGLLLVGFELLRAGSHVLFHGLALLAPPLLTVLALQEGGSGR